MVISWPSQYQLPLSSVVVVWLPNVVVATVAILLMIAGRTRAPSEPFEPSESLERGA
jgi:hypothetical protein